MRFILCIACLMCVLRGCSGAVENPAHKAPVNRVIMICLDTFRFDRLREDLTPIIYKFAQESTLYTYCHAPSSWTLPSMAATFTGLYPTYAGMTGIWSSLPDQQVTIAEVFREAGWATYGISSNEIVSDTYGLVQGFDEFLVDKLMNAQKVIDSAIGKLSGITDEKFFFYIHIMDPHLPYSPPDPYRTQLRRGEGRFTNLCNEGYKIVNGEINITDGEVQQLIGLYEAECAFSDAELGRFFTWLKENNLWNDTAIVFFADHGEELSEHNDWFHGHTLHETVLHVPVIVKFPGVEPSVNGELTSLRMLGGILFDWLDIDAPGQFADIGVSYLEGVKRNGDQKGLITDDNRKIFFQLETGNTYMYDLNNDPGELVNLWDDNDDSAKELLARVFEIYQAAPTAGSEVPEPTEEQLETLRALGYLAY